MNIRQGERWGSQATFDLLSRVPLNENGHSKPWDGWDENSPSLSLSHHAAIRSPRKLVSDKIQLARSRTGSQKIGTQKDTHYLHVLSLRKFQYPMRVGPSCSTTYPVKRPIELQVFWVEVNTLIRIYITLKRLERTGLGGRSSPYWFVTVLAILLSDWPSSR